MFDRNLTLSKADPDVWAAIQKEDVRQEQHIELIASENYASPAVMEAQARSSPTSTPKVSGQALLRWLRVRGRGRAAGHRPPEADLRRRSRQRAAQLGSQANQGVYMAVLKPGDTVLGMSLAEGGHLTHGASVNASGKLYNFISYGLDENEVLNYAQVEQLAREHKPKLIVAGASAYALHIDFERMARIARENGALFMVDIAHYAGLVAGGAYPNPVPHADFVTSTTHKSLRGPRGGVIMMKAEHEKIVNSAIFPGIQGGPLMHVIAGKAVAFKEALEPEFKDYAQQVVKNAKVLADTLVKRGLRIVSGRTESHVMLVDLRSKGITGKEAEAVLGQAHITVNKNAIPNDPEKPFVTSGIRLGTPAMTTRGFKEAEAELTANLIADVLDNPRDEANIAAVRARVNELTSRLPVYGKK